MKKNEYTKNKSNKKNFLKPSARIIKSKSTIFTHPGGGTTTQGNKITKAHFRIAQTIVQSSVNATINIPNGIDVTIPTIGARGSAMGDLFQYYRIVGIRIKFRLLPAYLTSATVNMLLPGNCIWYYAICLEPASAITKPTTRANFIDFPFLTWGSDGSPNTMELKIGRKQLLASMPYEWLKCSATGVNDEDYVQMSFWSASQPFQSTTTASGLESTVDLEVEFRGDIDPAANPSDRMYSLHKPKELKENKEEFSFEE